MPYLDFSGSQGLIKNVGNLVSNVVNQFIVRPTGDPNKVGISGFVFDILDDEEVMMDSDITDHYVEDNYAVEDHIALRPIRFTLRGYIGELTDIFPNTFLSILTNIQSLSSIGSFLPAFTSQATQFYASIADKASQVGQIINQAKNLYDIFKFKSTNATKQQNAFQYFYVLRESRQLCDVETPFMLFKNMAIESVRALQKGDTKFITDFSITFKQIRTVSTVTYRNPESVGTLEENFNNLDNLNEINDFEFPSQAGRCAEMSSEVVYKGQTAGESFDSDGSAVNTGLLSRAIAEGII